MSDSVRQMFADIASKYDLLNDVLSLGIHKKWRRKAVELSNCQIGSAVLDIAAGTGDFSFEFAKITDNVTGVDFCKEMLDIAILKAEKRNSEVEFSVADAMNLPFDDNTFDIVSIAFGIRNVDDTSKAISEMYRVLKPDGRAVILEFGQPIGGFKYIYDFYSNYIMPSLGKLLAKSESAYTYLPETAAKYPCREEFLDISTNAAKFSSVNYHTLTFGIAYIYILKK